MEDEVCASGKIGKVEWSGLFEYYDDGEVYLDGVMRGPDFTRPFHIDLTSKGEDESVVDFVNGLLPRVCMALGIRKEVFGIDKLEVVVDGESIELKDIDEEE